MPSMSVSVPHKLSQEEATTRLKKFVSEMKTQFGSQAKNLSESWESNKGTFSFEVMGMSLSGVLNIEPDQVRMDGQFPMTALPFKGKIESAVRDKLQQLLA